MQYLAGLLVFSGIGSFLISDTLDFRRELRKSNSPRSLYLDLFRLLVLGGMALIGYMVAKETFHKPNDWIIFLAISTIGAFSIHILGIKRRVAAMKGVRRP
jgi:hypothetical protein